MVILLSSSAFARVQEDPIEVFFNDPFADKRDLTIQTMILDAIADAESQIDLATYNFTDTRSRDALLEASRRGVRVRIVIHSENASSAIIKDLSRGGIQIQQSRSDGLMHAKFLVIDQDVTISGSANMTVGSFFYDNNFMILIRDKQVASVFRSEFNEMFVDRKYGSNSPQTPAADVITLADGTRLLVRFSPDDDVEDILEALVYASKDSIQMLAYSFSSNDLGRALIERYDDGIDVEVIFEKEKAYSDGGGEAEYLKRAGVPIYMDGLDGLMHNKVMIFDESVVAAGSYNYTRAADERNDEQILIIESRSIADQFLAEYEKILSETE
jgi:phosphatidylserine/phosphatidylglycerophosphate/cardiolipin synthase-like enzyme